MLIGVVTAKFNSEITFELERGAVAALKAAGLSEHEIWTVRVPGAVEIPLAAEALLAEGCDGIVTLGAVIRGDTAHFDYVCQSVERGVTELMLAVGKPIGFGVLTTENEEQALARTGGEHGNKGVDAANTVLEMLNLLSEIRQGPPRKKSTNLKTHKNAGKKTAKVKSKGAKKAKSGK
jgi:6,7-dimethyl-8-ribityllumazine synthase